LTIPQSIKFLEKFPYPDQDPDYRQNLIHWSLDHVQPFSKISVVFIIPANRQARDGGVKIREF